MDGLTLATTDRGTTPIDEATLQALRSLVRGAVLDASAPTYDEARAIWNAMIDRRPGLIVQCHEAADVEKTVRFAREHELLVAVRGGGHNIAGNAICDGGIVIDLSAMRAVHVDAAARKAVVGPGATLADVDRETQKFGLAIPTGINSTTGIAGLTLGGGFGWLTRKLGLTIDTLLSAEVVTADGKRLRASATEHPDLFWALRGGGGNFGVVTEFEFQLSPVGPEIYSALVVHSLDDAPAVLQSWWEIVKAAPDDLTCWVVMRKAPPLPFLPEAWHGKEVLVLAVCYCGDVARGEEATAGLRGIGRPIATHAGPNPYCAWQQAFDPLLTPGARNYWKSHDLLALSDAAIAVLLDAVRRIPWLECEVFLGHVGGAAARVDASATAFLQRSTHAVMNVHGRWRDPAMDAACIGWARDLFAAMRPHAAGTAYVNFMPDDETDRVESVYGQNFKRLQQIKRHYDPTNFFRMNQNILPG